jgi:hypothetical protein
MDWATFWAIFLQTHLIAPLESRVASWFVFKPKIQIWVNFGGPCTGRCRHILWTLGPFYNLLLYFWTFGIVRGNLVFFPVLVFCTKENLATPPLESVT